MLARVSDQIAEALRRAEEAGRRAAAANNKLLKEDWLDMEQRWFWLVESLRFVEQADRFITDAAAQKKRQS
jgi:hypothetical protein